MSGKRPTSEWQKLLQQKRSKKVDTDLRELVRFLARRAAEEDYESFVTCQEQRKTIQPQEPTPDDK